MLITDSRLFHLSYHSELSSQQKRLPPFGKRLEEQLRQGDKPRNDIFLFLGYHAWQKAKDFYQQQAVLALPSGHSPEDYRWPVNGCSVLAFHQGGFTAREIERVAYVLLLAGATTVYVVSPPQPLVIYREK